MLDPYRRGGSTLQVHPGADRTALTWLALALASIAGLVILTVIVASHVVIPFDRPWLDVASTWTAWKPVWDLFSEAGNLPMIPTGFGFVLWLLYKQRRREAALVVLLFVAATVTSEGLKWIVARDRPQGSGAGIPGVIYSYPSGHSFEDVMILGMIALKLWRRWRSRLLPLVFAALVAAFVAIVCVARVAIAVHYPSDMLAGLFGGFAMLGLYAWFSRRGGWADRPSEPEPHR